MAEEVNVIKSGETHIGITLHRSSQGLTVSVKALPKIEEFFAKAVGNGEVREVKLVGRYWNTVSKEQLPLRVYTLNEPLEILRAEDGTPFRFDREGRPLVEDGYINLSFLRLAGISEGPGVSFSVAGVYSLDGARKLRDQIGICARKFYNHYLRPVDLIVQISTQELRL